MKPNDIVMIFRFLPVIWRLQIIGGNVGLQLCKPIQRTSKGDSHVAFVRENGSEKF